jgi:homoserine dehydrogenase
LLSSVEDVFNAVALSTDTAGDLLFYGRGAGAAPTASAVVADVIDIVTNGRYNDPVWREDNRPLLSAEENTGPIFVRAALSEREKLHKIFPGGAAAGENGELGFITPEGAEAEIRAKLRAEKIEVRATWRVLY